MPKKFGVPRGWVCWGWVGDVCENLVVIDIFRVKRLDGNSGMLVLKEEVILILEIKHSILTKLFNLIEMRQNMKKLFLLFLFFHF